MKRVHERVEEIAVAATAHNAGPCVWETAYDGDTTVLTMSSWPRSEEARKALEERGYAVEYVQEPGHPKIRVTPICNCRPLGGQHGTGCPARQPIVAPKVPLVEEGIASRVNEVALNEADTQAVAVACRQYADHLKSLNRWIRWGKREWAREEQAKRLTEIAHALDGLGVEEGSGEGVGSGQSGG